VDAGLVLVPGALVITLFAPITAQLIQRQLVPARVLLAISISTVGAAMWYFSTFTPATDYSHYALARAYPGLGYGFFFVPVNMLAWSQLRPDQNNRASSLTNLFRNWGGSLTSPLSPPHHNAGISFIRATLGPPSAEPRCSWQAGSVM
jgi:DHA2 family multidrug resistance protein